MKKLFVFASAILMSVQALAGDIVFIGDKAADNQGTGYVQSAVADGYVSFYDNTWQPIVSDTNYAALGQDGVKSGDTLTSVQSYVTGPFFEVSAKHVISVGTAEMLTAYSWAKNYWYAPYAYQYNIEPLGRNTRSIVDTLTNAGVTDIVVVVSDLRGTSAANGVSTYYKDSLYNGMIAEIQQAATVVVNSGAVGSDFFPTQASYDNVFQQLK